VLGICFVLCVVGRSGGETFPVFLLPIAADFGWDRAQVVSIYSFGALSVGLASPFVGRLFDHSGPRAVYGLGLLLLGGGLQLAAYAHALWHLQLCIGAAGLGGACLGNVASSLLLGRWFGPRLPTAMAVVFAATGIGTLLWLPFAQVLIDAQGWRGAYRIIGGAVLLLAVPLLVLPWRRLSAGSGAAATALTTEAGDGWRLASAMRHHAFWALFSTYFFTAVGMFCISAQVVAYLVEAGFPPLEAATAWGFSGLLLAVGMVSVSLLDGLLGRRGAILLAYGLSLAGIVMLWLLRAYPSIWLLAGFIICFGSTIGSRGPLISATAMTIFRGPRVGTIFGAISLGSGLGAALGSWGGGLIHDWTNSYDPVIAFALINVLLGMMPFLVVPALRR
jgi:MFS family permease